MKNITKNKTKKSLSIIGGLILFPLCFIFAYYAMDYVYENPTWSWCINGFHIHHLYIGFILMIISAPILQADKQINNKAIYVVFLIVFFIGVSLFIDDVIIHVTIPFSPYCVR